MVQFAILKTDLGNFGVLISESKLIKIILPNKLESIPIKVANPKKYEPFMIDVLKQLSQYFNGSRKQFELDLKLQISPFYQKVLNEVCKIPYGQTRSYKNIAKKIKNPRAYRAVANANATNPIPIIIPCHRVIQSNGKLGKYRGGEGLKYSLIEKEKNSNMLN
jgi:methylated-DNA-[protein]-cysteine S-methyltransferase